MGRIPTRQGQQGVIRKMENLDVYRKSWLIPGSPLRLLLSCPDRGCRRNFDYLIEVVETPKWLFGWAKMAIVFLGKLDAARGSRAAQVIRSRVYDSADSVIALRDRVLSRLESASSWRTCPDCCFGLIHSRATGFPEPCQYCLGLGLLQSTG
jgi:hypothetical protein